MIEDEEDAKPKDGAGDIFKRFAKPRGSKSVINQKQVKQSPGAQRVRLPDPTIGTRG